MKIRLLFFLPVFLLLSCLGNKYKVLDLKMFSISIPENWVYIQQSNEGSFAGAFSTGEARLQFEYSDIGYASFGPVTEKDYLESKRWLNDCQFCDAKIADSVQIVKIQTVNAEEKLKFSKAQYIAEVNYKGDIINVPITIPKGISTENCSIDTNANYIVKTVWPKEGKEGETGIYIKSRKTALIFNLAGPNLSAQDQKEALKAFKTLKLN